MNVSERFELLNKENKIWDHLLLSILLKHIFREWDKIDNVEDFWVDINLYFMKRKELPSKFYKDYITVLR